MTAVHRLTRAAARPLRAYLDVRFDRIERQIDGLREALLVRNEALARIDVSRHNRFGRPPCFERPVSQVVSGAQFESDVFSTWYHVLRESQGAGQAAMELPVSVHRKYWEWAYVLRVAELHGLLAPGRSAVGFGVGREPLPRVLASRGLHVLATDREPMLSERWVASSQHMGPVEELDRLAAAGASDGRVRAKYVDMTDMPPDLGTFDLVWSCGSLEHLGSPQAGLEFVLRSLDLVEPGGLAVHVTELDLVPHDRSTDYGDLAAYQLDDLEELVTDVRARGFEIEPNWYVCLDTPNDRWISLLPGESRPPEAPEPAHLKLAIGDSVLTSAGLVARRPHPNDPRP